MAETKHLTLHAEDVLLPERHWWQRLPFLAIGFGLIGLVASFGLGSGDARRLLGSYLTAYFYFLSLALGALIFVLIQHATRAGWSVVVRRVSEHLAGTLPLFALLFVPLFFGVHELFEWSHKEVVASDRLLQHKEPFLNASFFQLRAVLYLLIWTVLGLWFRRQSLRQDVTGDSRITRRLQALSAPGIILFAVTLTFASFDWLMSLDPHWYSTIFGVYIFSGSFVAILALLIVLSQNLASGGRFGELLTNEHFHDLGKLLFGFVVFWGYIGFSQFMLIWYGNIPEETIWFAHRLEQGWEAVTFLLVVGHFVVPFLLLLSRDVKRQRLARTVICLWLLAMHYVDLYWVIMPAVQEHGLDPALSDLVAFVAVGGLFFGLAGLLIRKTALVPVKDPRLGESVSFENV